MNIKVPKLLSWTLDTGQLDTLAERRGRGLVISIPDVAGSDLDTKTSSTDRGCLWFLQAAVGMTLPFND